MRVFISWSGSQSKAIASALREWLPNVIQFLDPFMSSEDIEKGARWSSNIATQLENARAGIICLTPENLDAPWIHFEAGALSKTLENTFVCPYLFNVNPTELRGPLVQFQAAVSNREDTGMLIHTINKALGELSLPENRVAAAFKQWWPQLEEKIKLINSSSPDPSLFASRRTDRDLLEEMLELIRGLERARQVDEMLRANEKYARALADLSLANMRTHPIDETQLRKRIEKHAELIRYFIESSGDKTLTGEVVSQTTLEEEVE
jgi:hypothetical protein